jgi:DNA polymerase III alpha subunit
MQTTRIKFVKSLGIRDTLDFEVDHPLHNFIADGVVVGNSHSASYSTTAAKLVYLKFKYPQQFYLECLKIAQHKADSALEIGEIAKEMKMMGLSLLPPDILKSKMDFYIEGNSIRFALGSVKGVAEAAISKLKKFIDAETSNKFEVFEAAKSCKLNIGIFSSLIQAGAISSISEDRPRTVLEAQIWNLLTDRERRYCLANGEKNNFDLLEMLKKYDTWLLESGVKMIKDTRIETIRRKSENYVKIYKQNSQFKLLSAYFYETKLLGYSHSHTLKEIFEYSNEYLSNTKELKNNKSEGEGAETVCRVVSVRKGLSKKGDEYIKMVLGDEYGNFDFMMFGRVYDKFKKEGGAVPEEGNILFCSGRMGKDILWIERMAVQDYNIYSKLADLKETI